ncbi:outer membrane protein [Legionella micdadei]|uniref:Opacity protein n=1 Tax=Legionella micdadei TaxID=451 RepID=A0A098GIW4_LEGMI|nr:outer membrane beta-barrel protein [Legionella micdadei]ARG97130.1 hypothetical protein B6N58_05330 [Legionella micdadei]ARH00612.1 hypothetical protein B6V88_09370 [Legionella micdadei]KTD29275.1 opacity protein-like surface antigen [Legionella micdadei]NSL17352.1 outer membrane beta-barrel protein [Legionella micdadei]CEG61431.1 exported protein of unknown function [Legionella micdadei]
MKRSSQFALTSLFLANSVFAATPSEGWYWGLMGGLSYTPSIDITGPNPVPFIAINNQINPNPTPVVTNGVNTYVTGLSNYYFPGFTSMNGSLQYGVGGDFGIQLGYRICNFRAEGELLFNYAPLSMVKIGGVSIKKHVTLTDPLRLSGQSVVGAGLINGYYDFYDEENDPTWVPYLGLGIGYAYVRNTITFTVPYLFKNLYSVTVKGNESAPIGQAILGISYFASDDLSIGLDYRYITTRTISSINSRIQTNTLNLNFNYYFSD